MFRIRMLCSRQLCVVLQRKMLSRKFCVHATPCEQLRVGALLREFSILQNANPVGFLNGGKPMGNDEASAAGTEILQGFLNESLRFVVERGGRFIQQEEWWIL